MGNEESLEPTRPPESPEPKPIGEILHELVVEGDNFPGPPTADDKERALLKEKGEADHYWRVVNEERQRLIALIQSGKATPEDEAFYEDVERSIRNNTPEHIANHVRYLEAQQALEAFRTEQSAPDEP